MPNHLPHRPLILFMIPSFSLLDTGGSSADFDTRQQTLCPASQKTPDKKNGAIG